MVNRVSKIILAGVICIGFAVIAQAQTAVEAKRSVGTVFQDCPSCPKMVVLPGGSFLMGSSEDEKERDDDEGPQHRVHIQSFAMGVYEVTFDEWAACAAEGYCQSNKIPRDHGWGRGSRPVINVSWYDMIGKKGFIAWLNSKVAGTPYRLPSEAEWEYAARAGSQSDYSFGDNAAHLGDYAWFVDNSSEQTHPVGQKQPNAFGLYDMHGNVWEWVQDCWNDSYKGAPTDGSAWLSGNCSFVVFRGGACNSWANWLHSANRVWLSRYGRYHLNGFRIARITVE